MFNFLDDDFFKLYHSIKDKEIDEFKESLKNIDSSNVNNTLTIRGVKFFPDSNTNMVNIYLPILNLFSLYIDEYKFAYAWAKQFDKLENVYGYVNKIRLLAL